MGGHSSKSSAQQQLEAEAAVSHDIDAKLKREKRNTNDFVKLLLLGSGESGKSTIFKQMKILHNDGFSDKERKDLVPIIVKHTIDNFADMLSGACKLELLPASDEAQARQVLHAVRVNGLEETTVTQMTNLWRSRAFQDTFNRKDELQLADSTALFLSQLQKISHANYIPSDDHVLACRVRSTGVSEMTFTINQTKFRMVDVGGQRNERRKWIHCFEDVQAVLFVVAISEYNQTMFEDEQTNRIVDSLALFDEIVNHTPCFSKTSIILFLNKRDLFEEKVARVDLKICFPSYTGGLDVDAATEYMQDKFVSKVSTQDVYTHVTCATNTDNMRFVFDSVRDSMIVSGAVAAGVL